MQTLTIAQTAERLSVDARTVRRWIRTEKCPVIKDGRKIRIPAAWAADPKNSQPV